MRKIWVTTNMIKDTDAVRVAVDALYYSQEDLEDDTVTPAMVALHVYFEDDADPSLEFTAWTPEIEQLSLHSFQVIMDMLEAEHDGGRKKGEADGEERIVKQVHRLLGVDRIVEQLSAGLGERY